MGRWRHGWVGTTTLATARKEKQRPQAWCQRFNRVRSAITQRVSTIEVKKVNDHKDLRRKASGQLRNPGSCQSRPAPLCLGNILHFIFDDQSEPVGHIMGCNSNQEPGRFMLHGKRMSNKLCLAMLRARRDWLAMPGILLTPSFKLTATALRQPRRPQQGPARRRARLGRWCLAGT